MVGGQAPGDDADDRERDREVREAAHAPQQLLGVAHAAQPHDVLGDDLVVASRAHWSVAMRILRSLPAKTKRRVVRRSYAAKAPRVVLTNLRLPEGGVGLDQRSGQCRGFRGLGPNRDSYAQTK